jgi:vancomycin resistance protein YoaR
VLQKFTTEFSPDAANRNHNITLAAKAINGVAVRPGEVFSYNETVGPTSKARGYKLSQIFKNGRKLKGYGGGVCQVSSTLYNAVDAAGMQIVERHPHSRKVSYVPPGRDAATSYGSSDFKFKNTQPYPIVIEAATTASSVTVTISAAA